MHEKSPIKQYIQTSSSQYSSDKAIHDVLLIILTVILQNKHIEKHHKPQKYETLTSRFAGSTVHADDCINEWYTLQWHHNEHDGISNHQPHHCLLNCLFRCRSKKSSKLRVTGLCVGNSPVTGEFPTHRPVTWKMFPFYDVIMNCNIVVLGMCCCVVLFHRGNPLIYWE